MRKLRNIIDTWNMIDKYKLEGAETLNDSIILLPESEYNRLLESVKNKRYIKNLLASNN